MKRSLFDRLAGYSDEEEVYDAFDDELPLAPSQDEPTQAQRPAREVRYEPRERERPEETRTVERSVPTEGQLPVDVHQSANDIVIRAFVAGVRPDELGISISRDMVEISGARAQREEVATADYFTRELFWGSFSRTILLPQEVDVESSSASAKDGLLTIVMPKLDRAKQTKLKVKSG